MNSIKRGFNNHATLEEGTLVDPNKVEAIINWSTSKNIIDARSFMGLADYYKRFIEGFYKLAHFLDVNKECKDGLRSLKKPSS